jgi:hypothetical protein
VYAVHKRQTGHSGLNPFKLLNAAPDELVAAGVMMRERQPGTGFSAWSAVHGLAMLVVNGPLASVVGLQREQLDQRLLDMV